MNRPAALKDLMPLSRNWSSALFSRRAISPALVGSAASCPARARFARLFVPEFINGAVVADKVDLRGFENGADEMVLLRSHLAEFFARVGDYRDFPAQLLLRARERERKLGRRQVGNQKQV